MHASGKHDHSLLEIVIWSREEFHGPPAGLLILSLWCSNSEDIYNDQLSTGMQKCELKLKQKLAGKTLLLVIKLWSSAHGVDGVDCPG